MYEKHKDRVDISMIDWQSAQCIGHGEWSDVWSIGNGIVAKVGISVEESEARAQQYIYERYNAALPVLGHQEKVMLPEPIRIWYCPKHGHGESEYRSDLFINYRSDSFAEYGEIDCSCAMPLDVLCMPLADPDYELSSGERSIEQFTKHILTICEEELQRFWESHGGNVAWWHGHLVALDFMDDEYYSPIPYPVHWILHEEFPFAVYDDTSELQFYASLESVKQAYGSMKRHQRISYTIYNIVQATRICVEDLWDKEAASL